MRYAERPHVPGLSLTAIRQVGAEVALPVTVATPILLVLIIGRVFYNEHLRPVAWLACILGMVSVALLAAGTGTPTPAG